MITIKNTQRKISIKTGTIKKDSATLLDILGYEDFDLGIWFTTNATMQKYNQKYRKKNKPTDILSFPYHQNLKPGQRIKVKSDDDKNLGDIIISAEYVKNAAQKLGVSFEKRLQVLLVHGICHLLGYDHETDADYKIMHNKELSLLRQLS